MLISCFVCALDSKAFFFATWFRSSPQNCNCLRWWAWELYRGCWERPKRKECTEIAEFIQIGNCKRFRAFEMSISLEIGVYKITSKQIFEERREKRWELLRWSQYLVWSFHYCWPRFLWRYRHFWLQSESLWCTNRSKVGTINSLSGLFDDRIIDCHFILITVSPFTVDFVKKRPFKKFQKATPLTSHEWTWHVLSADSIISHRQHYHHHPPSHHHQHFLLLHVFFLGIFGTCLHSFHFCFIK